MTLLIQQSKRSFNKCIGFFRNTSGVYFPDFTSKNEPKTFVKSNHYSLSASLHSINTSEYGNVFRWAEADGKCPFTENDWVELAIEEISPGICKVVVTDEEVERLLTLLEELSNQYWQRWIGFTYEMVNSRYCVLGTSRESIPGVKLWS